jgi:hypothetical protein
MEIKKEPLSRNLKVVRQGLPVISTFHAGIPMILDGETGFCFRT